MTTRDRIARVERTNPPAGEERRAEAELAVERGKFSWTHVVRMADSDDVWARHRTFLMEAARVARARRERGEPPVLGDALWVAAEILSYRPEEPVPPELHELLDALFALLRDNPVDNPLFPHGRVAAEIKLVLHSRDGFALRQEIWLEPEERYARCDRDHRLTYIKWLNPEPRPAKAPPRTPRGRQKSPQRGARRRSSCDV